MTNSEAIKIINHLPNYKPWEVEALAMAIKALDTKYCEVGCENCKYFITRDSRGVVLCGNLEARDCEFDPKEKNDEINKRRAAENASILE